jgi:phosphomevalonate kinase
MEKLEKEKKVCLGLHEIRAHSKCLISGGYFIVLDGYKGLVLATEDYFTCQISEEEKKLSEEIPGWVLSINSP